jgi:hypothetical protein
LQKGQSKLKIIKNQVLTKQFFKEIKEYYFENVDCFEIKEEDEWTLLEKKENETNVEKIIEKKEKEEIKHQKEEEKSEYEVNYDLDDYDISEIKVNTKEIVDEIKKIQENKQSDEFELLLSKYE